MIWVLDNGKSYSDHRLAFVETQDGFDMQGYIDAVYEEIMAKEEWGFTYPERWKWIAKVPSMEWRERSGVDNGFMTIEGFEEALRDGCPFYGDAMATRWQDHR
jgi:hypothetical protein